MRACGAILNCRTFYLEVTGGGWFSMTKMPRMVKTTDKRRKKNLKEITLIPKKRSKVSHRSLRAIPGSIALTFGEGDVGQLGLGEDVLEKTYPSPVRLPQNLVQVCAGGMHTVCLSESGEVYTFGCNDEGALGWDDSKGGLEALPEKVDLNAKIIQVSAGDSHTAALTEDGNVFIWGNFRDANGSLGLLLSGPQRSPTQILPNEIVVKISSGSDHLVMLTENGNIFTLGCAEQGQLGRVAEVFATRGGRRGIGLLLTPSIVRCKSQKLKKSVVFCDVWTGHYTTFAEEKDTGDIYGWGLNNYYQLGFSDMKNRFIPQLIESFTNNSSWINIIGGQHHTVLLDSKGRVYTLGRANYGRLGLGEDVEDQSSPAVVTALNNKPCEDVGAGGCVSFAAGKDGVFYAWGMGSNKQLGTGNEDDAWRPVQIKGKQLQNKIGLMISGGGQHTVLLCK